MHVAEPQANTGTERSTVLYPARNRGKRTLTAEDLWKFHRVGAPAPSPDGTFVIAPVTTYDMDENRGRTRLWLVPRTGDPRPLTAEGATATEPALSPDAKRIVFARCQGEEKPQIHLLSLEGGEAERLTDMPLGAFDPKWFPDGKRIAFGAYLYAEAPTPEGTKELAERRAKDPVKVHITSDRVYRYWDKWLTAGEVPHLFVLDLETRTLTDLTPEGAGWFDFMEPAGQYDIAPDGSEIVYTANSSTPPHYLLRWVLFTVPTNGKGPIRCLTPVDGKPENISDVHRPRYSPDGKSIVYGFQRDPFFYADRVRLARYDRTTGEHGVWTEAWDRSPSEWAFLPDGTLAIEAEDEGRGAVFHLGVRDTTPRRVHASGTAAALRAGKDGRIYFTQQSLVAPAEVVSIRSDGSDPVTHTRFNAPLLEEIAMGEVRSMVFQGADGNPVQMYVILPPGFDPSKKYPLVQVIHGGPHAISGDNFHFRWNPQLFAAPGYVVATVNFHGSTSWGQEFAACIQGGHGDKPYTDIMNATDTLIATGFVDETRMAAIGGSYGGYLVCWIAGNTDRFRCLINHAGVFDLLAEYGSDITQGRHQAYGGEPWDRLEAIDRWNPARFARGFTSPMLVIHGERDYRVPHGQALAVYNIYQAKRVESRLVFFPDENHWVLKPKNSLVWNREVRAWLERFLAGSGNGTP
ncbi:MAG TPA: S9 family peptidase [Candidatus Eisenbacteria bacterium]|nr:S9 family peptidase [Candidatus Eisenbacteria bacterium]